MSIKSINQITGEIKHADILTNRFFIPRVSIL